MGQDNLLHTNHTGSVFDEMDFLNSILTIVITSALPFSLFTPLLDSSVKS